MSPDSGVKQSDGTEVYFNISSKKTKLLFEMKKDLKTNSFISELVKAVDGKYFKLLILRIGRVSGDLRNLESQEYTATLKSQGILHVVHWLGR